MQLETPRLILRTPTLGDAAAIAAAINDPLVTSTMLPVPYPYSVQDAISWINSFSSPEKQANPQFSVFLKETGELIGGVGLSVTMAHKRAEIGYWCAMKYWGMGITTEAASRVVQYAFQELHVERIQSICMALNPASARVMQKIGMQFECTARNEYFKNGAFHDFHHYAILREDWEKLNLRNQNS